MTKHFLILFFSLFAYVAIGQNRIDGTLPTGVNNTVNEVNPVSLDDNDRQTTSSKHPLGLLPTPIIRKDTRYTYDDFIWRKIDTSLLRFHDYNITSKWETPYKFLGIVGQNYQSLTYTNTRKAGYNNGFNAFSRYWYKPSNTKYYNTKVPYASIYYNLGPSTENNAHIAHSQNISPYYNIAVDYRLTNAQGAYKNQKTLMHNLNLNNWFNSKNYRYTLMFAFIFNRLELNENGGVQDTSIFSGTNNFTDKDLLAVNLDNAKNDIKNKNINLKQIFHLGKKDSIAINDSTNRYFIQRKYALSYKFNYDRWLYDYEDQQNSNDTYYSNYFFDSTATNDSSLIWTTSHKLRFENTPEKYGGDSGIILQPLRYFVELENSFTKFRNLNNLQKWSNLAFSGGIATNSLMERKWHWGAYAKLYVDAKSIGDYELNGFAHWKINDKMHLKATVESMRSSSTQKESDYRSNHFVWQNDFKPVHSNMIDLKFRCDHGDIDGRLTWHNIQNYIYLDDEVSYKQASNNINVLVFSASKAFTWKHFYLYNGIVAQYISDREKINLPQFILKQSFHYKGGFIKGKLNANLGIDISYNTNYMADAYNPSSTQFYRQNASTLKFYPVLDAYFEIAIKQAKVFFLMQHLNQGMFKPKGYFVAPAYAAQDRAFKLGFSWKFFD